jgi:hypothetical protein
VLPADSPVKAARSSGAATPPRSPVSHGANRTPPAPDGADAASSKSCTSGTPSTAATHAHADPPFCSAAIAYQPSSTSA